MGAAYCDVHVCLSVCLSACLCVFMRVSVHEARLQSGTSIILQIVAYVTYAVARSLLL